MKIEIINKSKFLLLSFTLLFLSCQKDYYLDDLNDALAQIQSLQERNTELSNKITELGVVISQKTTENSILQSQYDQLYADFLESEAENEELNNRLEALAEQLREQIAVDNGIKDGYYIEYQYKSTRNDTILYDETESIPNQKLFSDGLIFKVINGKIVEDFTVMQADYWWNIDNQPPPNVIKKLHPYNMSHYHKYTRNKIVSTTNTGDSLGYYKNYKVIDHDIFYVDKIMPNKEIGWNPNVFTRGSRKWSKVMYRMFSEPLQLTDNIIYDPVVEEVNGVTSISQYPDIYDYYSETNIFSDSIYREIDPDDPISYFNAFIKDAERHGIDLSNINTNELNVNYSYFPGPWAAWASINCSQVNNTIGITKDWWDQYPLTDDIFSRLKVMYHEFGHTVLGLRHTCSSGHIMHVNDDSCLGDTNNEYDSRFQYEVEHFKRAVKDLFEGYNQYYYECYLNNTTGEGVIIVE